MSGSKEADSRFPAMVAAGGGAVFLALGIWAFTYPASFFDYIAAFEPYNRHFIQDIGAFQIGLGLVLLFAAFMVSDALTVALTGVGVGGVAHLASHIAGLDAGGNPAFDVPAISLLAILLLWAGISRWRRLDRRG